MANVEVDYSQVKKLGKEVRAGMVVAIGRLAERGYQLLRKEVPYQTGNLKQGVAPPAVDEANLSAILVVSARSARRGGGSATVHNPSGKTKQITLKPQIEFNYAEVVAKGRPAIYPHSKWTPGKKGSSGASGLLIEVDSAPSDGSYITAGDKIFVVRRSAAAQKANPFDDRAAEQLEKDAPTIVEKVFGELFN